MISRTFGTANSNGNSLPATQDPAYQRSLARIIARRATPILAGGGLMLAGAAQAATINVDGNTVAVAADGDCSLLEAIVNANVSGTHADCGAGSVGSDTVVLSADTVFSLTADFGDSNGDTGLPEIQSQIIIQGNGSIIERADAAPDFRILAVGETGSLTVDNATLRGGRGDGGFLTSGALLLRDATVSGNSGGNGGGGSVDSGILVLERSTISGNTGNVAGGLYVDSGSTATITNSTVSGNASPVGGIFNTGELAMRHTTLADNGSYALFNVIGTTYLSNSLIVGGRCSGAESFTLDGVNIASDASCTGLTIDAQAQTLLEPLADNGGPTQTHVLRPKHPAVDAAPTSGAGDCPSPTTDQRGVVRPQQAASSNACDVGSVEIQRPISVGGPCSLSEAIANANDTVDGLPHIGCAAGLPSGHDTIVLPDEVLFEYEVGQASPVGQNAFPSITSPITIEGNGSTIQRTPDAELPESFRFIHVAQAGNLHVIKLALLNGLAADVMAGDEDAQGGAIRVDSGLLRLTNSTLSGNTAELGGGGIFNQAGSVSLADTALLTNIAGRDGGGVVNENGSLILVGGRLSGNNAQDDGGGIYNRSGTLNATNSLLAGNSAGDNGGGINNQAGSLNITGSTLLGNSAQDRGAAIFSNTNLADQASLISSSTLSGNSASNRGGALHNFDGRSVIEFSTLTDNFATNAGGGVLSVRNGNTSTEVRASIISGNSGGDVSLSSGPTNSFQSAGDNIIGNGTTAAVNAFNQSGDQTGVTDPRLEPLANNGGPTETHLPMADSPAVDAVTGLCPISGDAATQTDQRGTARAQDGNLDQQDRCDIGAVERIADAVTDTDNDNMPDDYELAFGLDVGTNDAGFDPDGDGLLNIIEFIRGAQPNNPDSEGDGLGDAIDLDPANDSNACAMDPSGPPGAMQFDVMAMAGITTQCASRSQITIRASATLETPDAELELFAPKVLFDLNVAVPLGPQLEVNAVDPVPGAVP